MRLIAIIKKANENIKKIKYADFVILFCVFFVMPIMSGCFSEIKSTQKEQSVYKGIDHSNAGVTTDNKFMYFNRSKGSEVNVYLREITATGEIALTYDSNENICVRGCSFGKDILFSSNKSGTFRVYKMNFENTAPVDILRNQSYNFLDAAFSKNGQFIVFSAIDRSDANYSQICMSDAGGENFKIITSTETLKRKPTVSADNNLVMFQKKVNGYWGLYYVDLAAADKVEKEFLVETNLDVFDPEFLASNAQSVSGMEELIYMHGRTGSSVRMERAYLNSKAINVVKNFSTYYYFNQPAVSNDGKTVLFLQKPISGSRFDVWKTTLGGYSFTQLTN
ncbi:MAG TPA: hypothetical protein PK467_00140 [Candidatus Wallbacteria bacterium]|nr:hypothetical protein [Candidatus Wallbacteria bacterium]